MGDILSWFYETDESPFCRIRRARKQAPLRSSAARLWFYGKPCAVCGSTTTTALHEPLNDSLVGMDGPDDEQVPLCIDHKLLRHDMGAEAFYAKFFNVSWRSLVMGYRAECRKELGI